MSGTDTANMVPSRYDVIIDGYGYIFWNGLMQSLPFRNQRAAYSHTRTFLERTNVSGKYGDNDQDFFLTASQDDWSGGEGQRFLRVNDQASASRYWQGEAANILVPGQAAVQTALDTTITTSFGTLAAIGCGVFLDDKIAWCDSNGHLWTTLAGAGGTAVDIGAHGAGTVDRWGMAVDPNHIYIAGATNIRKWNGSAFSDFAAVADAGSLAFLNNVLYSCDGATLRSYDTTGAVTTEFIWKDAVGTTVTPTTTGIGAKIVPYGGKLLIFLRRGTMGRPELWIFDSPDTEMVAQFPESSLGYDIVVINGIAYLSGAVLDTNATGSVTSQPVIWYYLNGTLDELWRSLAATASTSIGDGMVWPALGSFQGRLLFDDNSRFEVMQYDPASGSFSSIGQYTAVGTSQANDNKFIASDRMFCGLFFTHATPAILLPSSAGNLASSGYIACSLVDFDNSLTKIFRGVKAEFTGTGTVAISYALNRLDTSYTTLTSSASSGVEVLFPDNTTGIAVALKFTFTGSVRLKRWYLRAAPVQQTFRRCQYVLDLTGAQAGSSAGGILDPVMRRDETEHVLTGAQMATNLNAAIASSVPIVVTDRFGTYTGVFEQGEGITELDEVRPGEFVAQVTMREI
jgi:hypothetical protein